MIRPLILYLILATSFVPQETSARTSQIQESSSTLLSVSEYTAFLRAVTRTSDLHELYHPSMSDQITLIETKNSFYYLIVGGQEAAPMLHLGDIDVMRYCNWKDHGSPTTGDDLEDSTEKGTYNFSENGRCITTNDDGEYQFSNTDSSLFSIIHLSPVEAVTSPLMIFGERGKEKSEQEQTAERERETARRALTMGDITQDDSNTTSRKELGDTTGPKEILSPDALTLTPNARPTVSKTSQAPSLVALIKTGFVAALLHTAQIFSPVMAQEALEHQAGNPERRDYFNNLRAIVKNHELTKKEIEHLPNCPGKLNVQIQNGIVTTKCERGQDPSLIEKLDQEYNDALKRFYDYATQSISIPRESDVILINSLIKNRKALLRIFNSYLAEAQSEREDLPKRKTPSQRLSDGSLVPLELPSKMVSEMNEILVKKESEYQEKIDSITAEIQIYRLIRDRFKEQIAVKNATFIQPDYTK